MAKGARSEQVAYAAQLRASGATWAEITDALRSRFGLASMAAARLAHGWSQDDTALQWAARWPDDGVTSKHVSSWECWPTSGHAPPLPRLARLAELYEVAVMDLVAGLADFRHLDAYPRHVDRRDFLVGAAASAALTATPLPLAGTRIGARDIARIKAELPALYALDDAGDGAQAFRRALEQAAAVRQILDAATYGPTVGRDLQILAGELTEMAGWTAFDLGRHGEARRLFGEALTLGQITGSAALSTLVMASMSLQATAVGAGREAVELAQAAQRTAGSYGSARLLSLLAAREALGHARAADAPAATAALARAEQLLDDADDPGQEWLAFWGPADFHGAVAGVHQRLGQGHIAERACRSAIAATPERYRRNRAGYHAQLAGVLVERGAFEEAATTACASMSVSTASGRVRARLLDLRPTLAPHVGQPAVAEALDQLTSLASA